MQTRLRELLTASTGRDVVSASVITQAGAAPQTSWIPEGGDEPAFLAYSVTKTLLAVLMLRLCEEGRIGLDDPLARWFPRTGTAAGFI